MKGKWEKKNSKLALENAEGLLQDKAKLEAFWGGIQAPQIDSAYSQVRKGPHQPYQSQRTG